MPGQVFQKTDRGKAEIAQRKAGLSSATRAVLIMVNGSDSVQVMQARGLGDVRSHLDALLALALIEPVAATRTPATSAAPARDVAQAGPPARAPTPAPAPHEIQEFDPQHLMALQRRAYRVLQPHFGPDTSIVAQAMLAARTLSEFRSSLTAIEAKLAIYMGRRQAAREIESLLGDL